jgi:hypothetical protein
VVARGEFALVLAASRSESIARLVSRRWVGPVPEPSHA